jgi:hypothetical protein
MKPHELDALIDECIEGRLSGADAARLGALLEESAAARARYWEAASIHGLLENSLQQASLRVITGEAGRESDRVVRLFGLRPLAAAAAGLVLGVFSASMVWAYTAPLAARTVQRAFAFHAEGFEDSQMSPGTRFPIVVDRWSGHLSPPITATGDVMPAEGIRMTRLPATPGRELGYAWRIVDLDAHPAAGNSTPSQLEVTASFNAPADGRMLRYQIRLAAFSQEPSGLRPIWNDEPVLFDTVLQHVGRNLLVQPAERGWKTLRATLEIPPGTRSVVISLAAGGADESQPPGDCYLDDIQARWIIAPRPVE